MIQNHWSERQRKRERVDSKKEGENQSICEAVESKEERSSGWKRRTLSHIKRQRYPTSSVRARKRKEGQQTDEKQRRDGIIKKQCLWERKKDSKDSLPRALNLYLIPSSSSSSAFTWIQTLSLRKEKGLGGRSPVVASSLSYFMLFPSILGGVPVQTDG